MPNQAELRAVVKGLYDFQKVRIMVGNRIVGNFRIKLGIQPGEKEEDAEKVIKDLLDKLRASYKKITDGVVKITRRMKFEGDGLIDTYSELQLIEMLIQLEKDEDKLKDIVAGMVEDFPIWTAFLEGVMGCGPQMAAVLISEIDVHKARHVSSLWKYAGLDVADDGRGRSRRKEHLVEREYVDRNGEVKHKQGITNNPFLKTKLIGVLCSSFLRAGKDNKYAAIYYAYKHRLENHAVYGVQNDEARKTEVQKTTGKKYSPLLHRHNMALRYMAKMFLADLWVSWRQLEGLEVSEPYHIAKLGMKHHAIRQ